MPLLRSVYKRQCDGFVCSFMHSPSGITSSGEASPEEQPTWRGTEVSDPQPCEEFGWERILQPQSSPQNLQLPVRLDCTSWRLSAEPHYFIVTFLGLRHSSLPFNLVFIGSFLY